MMHLHFDDVKDKIFLWVKKSGLDFQSLFTVRDIFGRISMYFIPNKNSELNQDEIKRSLSNEIGEVWVHTVEILELDSPLVEALTGSSQKVLGMNNVFFSERHITRLNWFDDQDFMIKPSNLNTKVVTFYSFKGGLGRTTSMVLTALQLCRQGKKIVLIDFDLEAPGLSSLLVPEQGLFPTFGVVDYILESQIYKNSRTKLDIDDYIYSFQDKELVGTRGGQLYVMPASQMRMDTAENYLEKMGRIDFGMPSFQYQDNPITLMLQQVTERFNPDYIFLDARTGIHDLGGLTLTKFSDLGVLLFYGNEQNIAGMNIVLPKLIKGSIPFFLLNGPVPLSESERNDEEEFFLENSYKILVNNGYYKEAILPDLYDKNADHFPYVIEYNPNASLINNRDKIKVLLNQSGTDNVYLELASQIKTYFTQKSEISNLNIDNKLREEMLDSIASIMTGDTAAAEVEFSSLEDLRDRFFPLKEHKFIFEQDKFLILGPKGSGKTALFSVLEHPEYAKDLAKYVGVSAENIHGTHWVTGLKNGRDFPTQTVFEAVGQEFASDIPLLIRYWRCLAIKTLQHKIVELGINAPTEISGIMNAPYSELKNLCKDISLSEKIEDFLQYLDQTLESRSENIILTYDALDFLLRREYRGIMLAALISLWFEYLPRYRSIRVKIFLRGDIFKNEVKVGVTDKVKLRNYTANLAWDYDYLLAMVWKRIVQKSAKIAGLINDALKPMGLSLIKYDDLIGYVPKADEEANKAILKIIIGEKMGKGNKTYSYNWIKYHLADTNDEIVPRSILALFVLATKSEIEQADHIYSETLIKAKNFVHVMTQVSEDRVNDLLEEYSEFDEIFLNLKNYLKEFPAAEEDFKEALRRCGVLQGNEKTVIDQLTEIGVVKSYQRRVSDPVRYHIPDIFLLGMGLSRKGPR